MATAVASRPSELAKARPDEVDGHFWRATDYDEAYWDAYVAGRPQYPSKLYDRIIEYYKKHNPSQRGSTLAHDVGTGPGQMAGELCRDFDHVVGSDANETHTAVAAIRLKHLESQLSWSNAAAEELANDFPPGSANLITVMEAIPLMDIPRAMDSFTRLLAPNGTLAIVHYGRANFHNPADATLQPILDKILALFVASSLATAPAGQVAFWKRASDTVHSQLDNVPFNKAHFHAVQRIKWNPHLEIAAFDEHEAPFKFEKKSAIDETNDESVIIDPDSLFWREDWNFQQIKSYCECQLPNLQAFQANQPLWNQVEEQYRLLEKSMAGQTKTLHLPAVLLLATKR